MLSSLSGDGHELLLVGKDNRVSLWDLVTQTRKRVYVEKHHLSHEYTCLAWHRNKKDLGILAVGCSDGSVILWDLVRGVVSKVISYNTENGIPSDLAFSFDGKSLFVVSDASPVVSEYSSSSGDLTKSWKGHKKGVLKLATHSKVTVLALGGSSVKLLDTGSDAKKKKLSGHFSGGVSALAFSQCGCFLAVTGISSREVLIYDVRAAAGPDAIYILPTSEPVGRLSVRSTEGCVDVFCCYMGSRSGGCLLRVDKNKAVQDLQINGEILAFSHANYDIKVASGSPSKPVLCKLDGSSFDRKCVSLSAGNDTDTNVLDSKSDTAVLGETTPPSVLGPNEFGGAKRPRVEGSLTSAGGDDKRHRGDSINVEGEELTMQQRLSHLEKELIEINADSRIEETPAPTSDSLVTLIDQALQTGDDALLEQCFACEDVDVVDATTRRLPSGRIVLLMRRLVSKFEKRPSRGLLLTRWLAALLRHHTAYLVTVPDLTAQLAGLSQMLEQRLSSYSRLSSLGGRLDLLLSRMGSNSGQSAGLLQPIHIVKEA